MFGKRSAIKSYLRHLTPELEQRYGNKGPYTQKQVGILIKDLGLSHRHIHYAYLIYCDRETVMMQNDISQSQAYSMHEYIDAVASGGFLASLFLGAFSGGSNSGYSGDDGDGSDGGGE